MPHLIPPDDIERLATLAGVHNFDEWRRQLDDADGRIRALLRGSISEAWDACLPTWLKVGRVRDLSRAVRVPKYWPSFGERLGSEFADVYRNEYRFLIDMLRTMPVESHEYLCGCDLLETIAFDLSFDKHPGVVEIYALDCEVPSVLRVEVRERPPAPFPR